MGVGLYLFYLVSLFPFCYTAEVIGNGEMVELKRSAGPLSHFHALPSILSS